MKKSSYILLILLAVLSGCNEGRHCPLCGESDTHIICDTVEHDVSSPILLEYGKMTLLGNGAQVTAYRHDAVVRHTQLMRRELECCSSCGEVIDRHYSSTYKEYSSDECHCVYSMTNWRVEQAESGKILYDFGYYLGSVIIN